MFKFSFSKPDGENDLAEEGDSSLQKDSELIWSPSARLDVSPAHLQYMLSHQDFVTQTNICNFSLRHMSTDSVVKSFTEKSDADSCVKLAEELHSDLVPAKYEGGLKIWECTEDLLIWLLSSKLDATLKGRAILDLGCGAGLLGIAALKHGAKVVFQDYNKEVLDSLTIPNVLLNLTDEECQDLIDKEVKQGRQCEFYSGDWSSLPEKLQDEREDELKFDYILTSETIYNPQNYQKLIMVFKNCLKRSGCVILAAKTYYFGVGGSLREFETKLQGDGTFKSEVCWKCPSGVLREILKITFLQ